MILKLSLNKEIYPEKAVKRAVKLYEKAVNFNLSDNKKYFLLSGKVEKTNAELVKNEFLNFVLGVIKQ